MFDNAKRLARNTIYDLSDRLDRAAGAPPRERNTDSRDRELLWVALGELADRGNQEPQHLGLGELAVYESTTTPTEN